MTATSSTVTTIVAQLEARARAASTLTELSFSIANDSFSLLNFRQAIVMAGSGQLARVMTLSGLAPPVEDSPYLLWLRRCWPWVQTQLGNEAGWLPAPEATEEQTPTEQQAPAEVLDGWAEWWPQGVYAQPILHRDGTILAWAIFLVEKEPEPLQKRALSHLAVHWGYCWECLGGKPRQGLRGRWKTLGRKRHIIWISLVALLCFPVRQSALAPAEIIALDATTISSPLDGVVKTFHVRPNQFVQAGEPLLSLDDTTLRNRLEVATQSVAVADAEWMSASQKAFDSHQSKGELILLQGKAEEKRAELAAIQAQLIRVDVKAPHDGIAVFGSADDWLGRPVSTGERILQVANPKSAGVQLYLPVADALVLNEQAPVKLFLTIRPLSPLHAVVTETSYQSSLSPEGVASYRLRAALDPDQPFEDARIGLHGTAKISGDRVPLVYYVLRRPLATLRAWSGL